MMVAKRQNASLFWSALSNANEIVKLAGWMIAVSSELLSASIESLPDDQMDIWKG